MLQTGQTLNNRYRIVTQIGQGGFGAVYRAWDVNLNIPCAVKENLDTSPEAQRQFQVEASLLSRLRHLNLPRVTDHFFIPFQGQYLVMDFVEGKNLGKLLEERGRPFHETEITPWLGQICSALEYLHSLNPPIVHRDLKPQNLILTPEGQVMVVDFGISKVYDPQKATSTGGRGATPGYSPPEQYGQGRTDARSDIYALGATLYTLLTRDIPPDSIDRLMQQLPLTPPRRLNPAISGGVEAAILHATDLRPTNRFQTVADFRVALLSRAAPPSLPPQPTPVIVSTVQLQPPPVPPRKIAVSAVVRQKIGSLLKFGPKVAPTMLRIGLVLVGLAVLLFGGRWLVFGIQALIRNPTPLLPGSQVENVALPSGRPMPRVFVPAGEFLLGSNSYSNEQPAHTVYLDAYWIGQTEVTEAMYGDCVAAGVCTEPGDSRGDDYPVADVDWQQANDFCLWAGGFLPSEAQWEKAARGPDGRTYPWGEATPACDLADFENDDFYGPYVYYRLYCGGRGTSPVGSYPNGASPYGALDMAGNVWEWVADWYDGGYYATSPDANPPGPSSGSIKVLRGGAWYGYDVSLRAAFRGNYGPAARNNLVGFRCAQE